MSGTQPAPNPNVPDVSAPIGDLGALTACMRQVRLGIRSLAGLTGPATNRAVTFDDLNTMGLTTVVARVASLEQRMTALEAKVAAFPPPP